MLTLKHDTYEKSEIVMGYVELDQENSSLREQSVSDLIWLVDFKWKTDPFAGVHELKILWDNIPTNILD